jgi:hypothetical protein
MEEEFFKEVVQLDVSVGTFKGKVPILYHDCTSLTALYTASAAEVKRFLPHPDMRLIEFVPGRCLVAFTAFEYRKTDIGPYNEFSIACVVRFRQVQIPGLSLARHLLKRSFPTYVWHLPVTTEIARVGGVELYGYPKFIGEIEFRRSEEWIECSLGEQGTHILTLKGKVLPTTRGKSMRYITYSLKGGVPLVTNVCINPVEYAQSTDRSTAELEIGTAHSICDELKSIGLGTRPLVYQFSPVNQAILFAGRSLMDR